MTYKATLNISARQNWRVSSVIAVCALLGLSFGALAEGYINGPNSPIHTFGQKFAQAAQWSTATGQYGNPDGTMTGNVLIASIRAYDNYGWAWSENVSVVAGKTYTLTFDYMHNDADPIVFFGDVVAQFNTSGYEYGHLTVTFKAATTGNIAYGIAIRGSAPGVPTADQTTGGDFALDNVKLVETALAADGTLATTGSGMLDVSVNNTGYTSTSTGQAGTGTTTHSQAYDINYTPVNVDLGESPTNMVTSSGDDTVIANNISTGTEGINLGAGDDSLSIGSNNVSRLALASGFDSFNGGTGTDTLKLVGGGITLDLTNVNVKAHLSGFEAVDLTGSGNNTLKLNLASVLDLSDNDALVVAGNAGDVLQIVRTAGVTANQTATSVTYNGQAFNAYDLNNDGVNDLLVQATITSVTFSG